MRRRIVEFALLCLCAAQMGWAQEFKLFERMVQFHGFASQGFVYTDQNNWLTMHSSQGSGAFTDFGANISTQVTDKFRLGAQIYDRNLGNLGVASDSRLGIRRLSVQTVVRRSHRQSEDGAGTL